MINLNENENEGIKQRILSEAVRLFSEKGFHGTSMREIASAAKCSLPMLYYYYTNKEALHYALAFGEFTVLIERLNTEVKRGNTILETYVEAIKQRKQLHPYDKAVYKLSLKAWLGFEGDSKVRNDIIEWENGRHERTKGIFSSIYGGRPNLEVFSCVMVRVMENMIMKIILFDEQITDEQILKELKFIENAINIKDE